MKDIKIIYKNNVPYGIRDEGGFLFFFVKISKYTNQEERYREEIEEQFKLADFLVDKLKEKENKELRKIVDGCGICEKFKRWSDKHEND